MSLDKLIKIKQKIEVRKLDESQYYVSSIQDIKNNQIHIDIPYFARRPLSLQPGITVKLRMMIEEGNCRFESEVVDFVRGQIPYFILKLPDEYEVVERRDFFRIDVIWDTECIHFENKDLEFSDKPGEIIVIKGKTANISGGGALLKTDKPINWYQFSIKIALPDGGSFDLKAQKVWTDKELRFGTPVYLTGIKFIEISTREQKRLIQYLFKIQARRRLYEKIGE